MTVEEAFDIWQSCYVYFAEQLSLGYEFTDKISECIEKQIPKKPVYELIYKCDVCGKIIGTYSASAYNKYCKNCGQAIDWNYSK